MNDQPLKPENKQDVATVSHNETIPMINNLQIFEITMLSKQVATLMLENKNLSIENTDLKKRLLDEMGKYSDYNKMMTTNNELLLQKSNQLEKENEILRLKIKELEIDNKRLREQNDKLREEIEVLKIENKQMKERLTKLENNQKNRENI